MTYTFKLARRLAVSRQFSMLPVILAFAACSPDATSPDGSPADEWQHREVLPVTVRVNPSQVTLETNQLIHFRAHGRTRSGDSVGAFVTWSTTGGTILPDGRFSAAAAGSYMVMARTRVRGEDRVDTSAVEVVRRPLGLQSITVAPASVALSPGMDHRFSVHGRLLSGAVVPVGVHWSATGGVIDGGGTYVAGDTAGTYQVIATNTARSLADTALVTISAPSTPPPPAPAPPPPALASLTLTPPSAVVAPQTTRQFAAYGHDTSGDSVAVNVTYSATGGTITPGGLFTAGSTAGTYRVIATSGSLADTSTVTVTVPLGSGSYSGIPFGAFHVPPDSLGSPSLSYNGAVLLVETENIKSKIEKVRARKGRVVLSIRRARTKDASGRLNVAAARNELNLWKSAFDLNSYLADGTVIAVYVGDDINGAQHWGGEKPPLPRIDSVAREVKVLWPSAVTIVRAKPTLLTGYTWRWLDAAWAQYNGPFRDGTPEEYRRNQVATAKSLKLGLVLWLNTLNGGCGPTSACLPGVPGSSILGTVENAAQGRWYQLSAAEVLNYGKAFLAEPYNCAAIAWMYSPLYSSGAALTAEQLAGIRAFDTRSDVRAAMAQLAVIASQRERTSCRQR